MRLRVSHYTTETTSIYDRMQQTNKGADKAPFSMFESVRKDYNPQKSN